MFQELIMRLKGIPILEQEPLSRHTTFRVGGPCAVMALPESEAQCRQALEAADELGIRPIILGRGSNVLAPDEGLQRFVIKLNSGLAQVAVKENVLTADAGITLRQLATFALEHELIGLEFAHGIPGTLGGAVVMNAGAYGGEMADVVTQTHGLTFEGKQIAFTGGEHDFSYRHSVFSSEEYVILSCQLTLQPGNPVEIKARMDALAEKRKASQPLDYPSAGSTFKRPKEGYAAALIEQCGLKGVSVGGAQVSPKHSGFLVNTGGATCRDILELMELVRETVLKETGILLQPEVKMLGGA